MSSSRITLHIDHGFAMLSADDATKRRGDWWLMLLLMSLLIVAFIFLVSYGFFRIRGPRSQSWCQRGAESPIGLSHQLE